MNKEIVTIKNLSVDLDGARVLNEHTLSIRERDFLGIIGPNGGGKTTLLKVILGLIKPAQGEITVFGGPPQRARHLIGYLPQSSSCDYGFPIRVRDVVVMGRIGRAGLGRRFTSEDRRKADEMLGFVGMSDYRDTQIGALSGGQRQRVFIARALVNEPKLLLLDEPTASIDPAMKFGLYEVLDKLKKDMAIVLVTHDVGIISTHVDKVACLNCELFYHDAKEITREALEATYKCPVDIIAHGLPHRVLKGH